MLNLCQLLMFLIHFISVLLLTLKTLYWLDPNSINSIKGRVLRSVFCPSKKCMTYKANHVMFIICVMAQRMCQDLGPNIRGRIPIEHKRILLIMYEAWQPTRRNTLWRRLDHVFSRDTYAFVHSILSHPDKPARRREVRALQGADGTYLRQPLQTHSPSSFSPAKNPKKQFPPVRSYSRRHRDSAAKPRRHMLQQRGRWRDLFCLSEWGGASNTALRLKNKTQAETLCGEGFLINLRW